MGIFWITGEERRKGDCHRDRPLFYWVVCEAASGWFHSLDLKIFNYSTKIHVIKGLVPSLWHHWVWHPLKEVGLSEQSYGY